MGYSYQQTGHPLMCFNAQKNWLSGWFDDCKIAVNPFNAPWVGSLTSFVDYSSISNGGVVVINIGNLYLQLNSAKNFNNETKINRNQVNVVVADVPSNPNTRSWSLAGLSAGQNCTVAGVALVIQVCNITFGVIDVAKVSIYLNNGIQSPSCGS